MQFSVHSLDISQETEVGDGVFSTPIDGMFAFPVSPNEDDRGFFAEVGKIPRFDTQLDKPFVIKQINHARSKKNVTRGFHAEDWNKLITVTNGVCFSAIADIRSDSPTFGTAVTLEFGYGENSFFGSIFLPRRVANSVCTLTEQLDYLYAVDKLYEERDPAGDTALSLFDESVGITWPISKEEMILSVRDTDAVSLAELLES